jgi:gas vesicle protein
MSDNGKVLSALLLGAAAGAVLGLLMAPDKGSNTRKRIQDGASQLIDELTEKIKEGKEAINDLREKAMNTAADLKDRTMSKAEQLKNDAEAEMNGAKQRAKHATQSN